MNSHLPGIFDSIVATVIITFIAFIIFISIQISGREDPHQFVTLLAATIAALLITFLFMCFYPAPVDEINYCNHETYLEDAIIKNDEGIRNFIVKCSSKGDRFVLKKAYTKLDNLLYTKASDYLNSLPDCSDYYVDNQFIKYHSDYIENVKTIIKRYDEYIPSVREHLMAWQSQTTHKMGKLMGCALPMPEADRVALSKQVAYWFVVRRKQCNSSKKMRVVNYGTIYDDKNNTSYTFKTNQIVFPLNDNAIRNYSGVCHVKVSEDLNFFVPLLNLAPVEGVPEPDDLFKARR